MKNKSFTKIFASILTILRNKIVQILDEHKSHLFHGI